MILNVATPRVRCLQTGIVMFISMILSSIVSVWLGWEKNYNGNENFMQILLTMVTGACVLGTVLYAWLYWVYPSDLKKHSDEKLVPLLEKITKT